jgi:hypothetical protein
MDVPAPDTPTAAEVPLKDTPTEIEEDAASDASRESWPDATALAALPGTAFSGEVHARRDNIRLGWRRCSAIVTRGDGAAEACLQLKEKTALVRELQLSNLSISIAEKTGALATTPLQAAPGGRPAFRIRVEAAPPLDLGFCGAAPASNTASRRVDGVEGKIRVASRRWRKRGRPRRPGGDGGGHAGPLARRTNTGGLYSASSCSVRRPRY